jgi:hypothetical protein
MGERRAQPHGGFKLTSTGQGSDDKKTSTKLLINAPHHTARHEFALREAEAAQSCTEEALSPERVGAETWPADNK